MTKEELEEYLDKLIKPAIENYCKEQNITVEELLQQVLKEKEEIEKRRRTKKK